MMMAKFLKDKEIFIKSINGGTNENDIATLCEAIINTKLDIKKLFQGTNIKIIKLKNNYTFSKKATKDIINQILSLKSGPKLKYASANLGYIKTINNKIKISYIFRSIEEKELASINQNTKKLNNNFKVSNIYCDSIWKIKYESELLKQYKKTYYNKYLIYPKEEICHGGSECSVMKKNLNELDIISIGSNIEKFHTTKKTYISSWLKIYSLLIELMKNL